MNETWTGQRQKRALKDGGCNSVLLQDEDGQGLTDEEIQAEANTFMFAGELVCKFFSTRASYVRLFKATCYCLAFSNWGTVTEIFT